MRFGWHFMRITLVVGHRAMSVCTLCARYAAPVCVCVFILLAQTDHHTDASVCVCVLWRAIGCVHRATAALCKMQKPDRVMKSVFFSFHFHFVPFEQIETEMLGRAKAAWSMRTVNARPNTRTHIVNADNRCVYCSGRRIKFKLSKHRTVCAARTQLRL